MKLLIFSYNFPPDISAGAFRIYGLVKKLDQTLSQNIQIQVITAIPNRYSAGDQEYKFSSRVQIKKIYVPNFGKNFISLAASYSFYFCQSIISGILAKPYLIIGTSSRFFTLFLSTIVAILSRSKLIIDLRDIFSESFKDNFGSTNYFISVVIFKIIFFLECFSLRRADLIIQVSPRFQDYFKNKILTSQWLTIMNGIDDIFLSDNSLQSKKLTGHKLSVVYAGNIGIAQALDKIIPGLALLNPNIHFIVIGDGSGRKILEEAIENKTFSNIEILNPMPRSELLQFYRDANILFLHLKDIPAFQKVLPSKIFEYGSMNKPILAGVSGFMTTFLDENFSNAYVFNPENLEHANKMLNNALVSDQENDFYINFTKRFSRDFLLDQYANEIKKLLI